MTINGEAKRFVAWVSAIGGGIIILGAIIPFVGTLYSSADTIRWAQHVKEERPALAVDDRLLMERLNGAPQRDSEVTGLRAQMLSLYDRLDAIQGQQNRLEGKMDMLLRERGISLPREGRQ